MFGLEGGSARATPGVGCPTPEKVAGQFRKAAELAKAGFPALAHQQPAALFNDPEMLAGPDPMSLLLEDHRRRTSGSATAATGPPWWRLRTYP